MRITLLAALATWAAAPTCALADTLFLRMGTSLKIEGLSCDALRCLVELKGGRVEVRSTDVIRVEPDEEIDAEALPAEAPPEGARVFRSVERMVVDAARRYSLPRSLVRAVAVAESGLNPLAVSPKGARGVMQLMPDTARTLGVGDALNAEENIDAGARLLRRLLEKYDGRIAEALAAYNAGEGAVARHAGVPPYAETRGYVRRVVKDFERGEKEIGKDAKSRARKP